MNKKYYHKSLVKQVSEREAEVRIAKRNLQLARRRLQIRDSPRIRKEAIQVAINYLRTVFNYS